MRLQIEDLTLKEDLEQLNNQFFDLNKKYVNLTNLSEERCLMAQVLNNQNDLNTLFFEQYHNLLES